MLWFLYYSKSIFIESILVTTVVHYDLLLLFNLCTQNFVFFYAYLQHCHQKHSFDSFPKWDWGLIVRHSNHPHWTLKIKWISVLLYEFVWLHSQVSRNEMTMESEYEKWTLRTRNKKVKHHSEWPSTIDHRIEIVALQCGQSIIRFDV